MRREILRAQATKSKMSMIALMAGLLLASAPLLVQAAQITPNPNPVSSTIDIVNDPFAVNNDNPFTNAGTININSSSTLTNSVGAALTNGEDEVNSDDVRATLNNAGRLDNYGVLSARNLASLTNTGTLNNFAGAGLYTIGGGRLTNTVGGIVNNYGIIINSDGGSTTNAGTLNNFDGAALYNSLSSSSLTNTGTLNNFGGALMFFSDSSLKNAMGGTVNNYGMMEFSLNLFNDGTFNNYGSFRIGSASALVSSVGATLRNSGVLSLELAGLTNAGTLINTGLITDSCDFCPPFRNYVQNSGTVINTGSIELGGYTQTAGQTINNGTLTAMNVDIQGGSLRGTGTITAPVMTLSSGAILSPGDATTLGRFTINGDLQSSGNLMFRIGGLNAGQFDVLAIHGMAFLNGGTVGFNFVNFIPVAGNSWDFLYAGAISGWETLQFNLGGLSPNLGYSFNYSNGVETLRVVSVPEPSSLLLSVLGLGALAFWRRLKGV